MGSSPFIRTNKKRANRLFFYWCHGERKLLEEGENLCTDGTRRENPQRFPLHTTPSLRRRQDRKKERLFYWCHGERKLLEEGENLCADGTRRENQQIPHGIAILSSP